MKKLILSSLALVLAFSGFGVRAYADTAICGDPAQSTALVTYKNCGNGNPENVQNVWGGTNSTMPHIRPGDSINDEGGVPSLCPSIISNYCVDISHTDYYRAKMIETGRQLRLMGASGGFMAYWINLSR